MAELRAAGSWGRWLTWLLVLMAGALTAASSLHLLGAEGLVQQLAASGYTVERL